MTDLEDFLSSACGPINGYDVNFNFTIWNEETKDFGRCFEDLVVVTVPSAALLFSAISTCCVSSRPLPAKTRFRLVSRHVLASLLTFTLPVSLVVAYAVGGTGALTWAKLLTYCGCGVAWASSIVNVRRRSCIGLSYFSYFLHLISAVILLRSSGLTLTDASTSDNEKLFAGFLMAYGILVIIYLACAINDARGKSAGESTALLASGARRRGYSTLRDDESSSSSTLSSAEDATICSRATFGWVYPLLKRGGDIHTLKDLMPLPENVDLVDMDSTVMREFEKERKKILLVSVPSDDANHRSSRFSSTPNLFRVFFRLFGLEFCLLGGLRLLSYCLIQLLGPLAQNLLLTWMQDGPEETEDTTTSSSLTGYGLAMFLCISEFANSFAFTHYEYLIRKLSVKVRSATAILIFRKIFLLKTPSRSKFSSGTTLNLISTDANRLENAVYCFHDLWITPLLILQVFYFMYALLGWSFLSCVGYVLLAAPLGHFMGKGWYKYGDKQMSQMDKRVKTVREVLNGVKVIKFQSWEAAFHRKISSIRNQELYFLRCCKVYDGCAFVFFNITPSVMTVLAILTYSLLGGQLTAATVFTTMSLIYTLVGPLIMIPIFVGEFIEAKVSFDRIKKYLNLLEEEQNDEPPNEGLVKIEDADYSWGIDDGVDYGEEEQKPDEQRSEEQPVDYACQTFQENEKPVILNVSFSLKPGELIGVVGIVGSGKSSLLSALLGDLTLTRGRARTSISWRKESVCFLPQESWLQQVSIKENVLFGRPMEDEWFAKVLRACQLDADVADFPSGVETEVGENGVTLSGGQKARVALARAVYANADIYVIDDPFAAVDPAVADKMFQQCVNGVLRKKTRIICTHHKKFLQTANKIIVMKNGKVFKVGDPETIFKDEIMDKVESSNRERIKSLEDQPKTTDNEKDKLVEDEQKMEGVVDPKVYWTYLSYTGTKVGVFIIVAILLMFSFHNGMDVWMTVWVQNSHKHPNTTINNATTYDNTYNMTDSPWIPLREASDNLPFYLGIYCTFFLGQFALSCANTFVFIRAGIESARAIHESLLGRILAAPLSFFTTTPIGRIINRFSSDLEDIDNHLANCVSVLLQDTANLLLNLVVICYGFPWFIVVLVPSFALYFMVQRFFRKTSREVKRIESISKSPIFSHFSDCLKGVTVVQAMKENERFVRTGIELVSAKARAELNAYAVTGWLGFWMGALAFMVIMGVALIAVIQHQLGMIATGFAGLAITYALQISWMANSIIEQFTNVEKMMVGVERILEYSRETPLEEQETPKAEPRDEWPEKGVVSFEGVVMRYRPDLDPALNGLSFSTMPAEKIGIIGRTGSGKSSVFNALFRIENLEGGRILVDGVDVSRFGRHALRTRLAIIPQDPYIFSGTVRENLDVDEALEDSDLWQVLEKCHLKEKAAQLGGLDAEVPEGGTCFSVGQKQLFCLARAIAKKSKILCIDEATANVDFDTDKKIQDTIRTEFRTCTVLTIAHRTETLADSNRILEISRGRLKNFSPPMIKIK